MARAFDVARAVVHPSFSPACSFGAACGRDRSNDGRTVDQRSDPGSQRVIASAIPQPLWVFGRRACAPRSRASPGSGHSRRISLSWVHDAAASDERRKRALPHAGGFAWR